MKLIKHALLGLLLATSAIAASAAVIEGYDFVLPTYDETSTLQTWNFSIGDDTVKANDTFNYDLIFNPPPSADYTYFTFFAYSGFQGMVSFSNAAFTQGFAFAPPNYSFNVGNNIVTGNGFIESNGIYDLHLEGTFLTDGATVVGRAGDDLGVISVPEPVSVSLILAGLAGMAGSRRRGAKAAKGLAQAA